jgi:hypothetical protein
MTLEWLRRNVPRWDAVLRTYLFTEGPITEIEEEAKANNAGAPATVAGGGDLGIGGARRAP